MFLCLGIFISIIIVFAAALPKDKDQNSKLLSAVGIFSFVVGLTSWFMAARYFSSDPTLMLKFMLAITFMMLAGSLVSVTLSSVQLGGLRDTIAANGGVTA